MHSRAPYGRRAAARLFALLVLTLLCAAACSRQADPAHVSAPREAAAPPASTRLLSNLPQASFSANLNSALSAISNATTAFVTRTGNWEIAAGVASEATRAVDAATWFDVVSRGTDHRDATIKVSIQLTPGSGAAGTAGLMFRVAEAGSAGAVAITEGSRVAILAVRGGRPVVVASQPADIAEGRWIDLTVTVTANHVRATVNGGVAVEADMPDLPASGRVGVFRQQGDGAQFRSLSLTSGSGVRSLPFDFVPTPAVLAPLAGLPAAASDVPPAAVSAALVRAVTLADDTRTSLMLLPDTEVRFPIDTPAGASLRSEIAVVAPGGMPQAGGSQLSLTLETRGGSRVLDSRHFAADGAARFWEPLRAELGQETRGTLVLRNTTIGEAGGATLALASPMLMVDRGAGQAANVVFVTIDTLRADRVGTYGYRRPTTPFLDQLAGGGVVFEDVVAQSSWTKTSMASMFTSTYPETNRVRGVMDKLPSGLPTLAEVMRQHGYFTAGVQANPWMHSRFNMTGGFDEYKIAPGQAPAARVSELATDVLRRRGAAPFFLYVHFMDVHHPYTPASPRFGAAASDLYDAEIRQLDAQLRALHAAVTELTPGRSTLFVVTSDHGEEFGEHGGTFHGSTVHREQIQVPWIVSWPDALKPARVAAEVANLDVAPTVLELLGLPRPATFEGQSRAAAMRGTARATAESTGAVIFSQTGLNDAAPDRDWLAALSGRWKYVRERRTGAHALYDRARDIAERHDAAAAHPEVMQLFVRRSDAFTARTGMTPTSGVALDSELRDRLRALGYLK